MVEFESFPREIVDPLHSAVGIIGLSAKHEESTASPASPFGYSVDDLENVDLVTILKNAVQSVLGDSFILQFFTQYVPKPSGPLNKSKSPPSLAGYSNTTILSSNQNGTRLAPASEPIGTLGTKLRDHEVNHNWIRKFMSDRLAILLDVRYLQPSPEYDQLLIDELVIAERSLIEANAAICIDSQSLDFNPAESAERKETILRKSCLDRNNLFFLDNWAQLNELMTQLKKYMQGEPGQAIYREFSKKYRKNMSAKASMFLAPWMPLVRYNYKLGIMDEFRGDLSSSIRHLLIGYSVLVEQFKKVPSDEQVAFLHRTLKMSDMFVTRISRLSAMIGSEKEAEEYITAHFNNYSSAFLYPSQSAMSPSARLYQWKTKLLFQYAEDLASLSEDGRQDEPTAKSHHYGYFFLLAALTALRQMASELLPTEKSAMISRKIENVHSHEELTIFTTKLTEILIRAYDIYRRIGATRFTLFIASLIAKSSIQIGRYDQALKNLVKLRKTFRADGFIEGYRDILMLTRYCAEKVGDARIAVECLWEIASLEPCLYFKNLNDTLCSYLTWNLSSGGSSVITLEFPSILNNLVYFAVKFAKKSVVFVPPTDASNNLAAKMNTNLIHGTLNDNIDKALIASSDKSLDIDSTTIELEIVICNASPLVLTIEQIQLFIEVDPSTTPLTHSITLFKKLFPGTFQTETTSIIATKLGALSVQSVMLGLVAPQLNLIYTNNGLSTRDNVFTSPWDTTTTNWKFLNHLLKYSFSKDFLRCLVEPVKPELEISVQVQTRCVSFHRTPIILTFVNKSKFPMVVNLVGHSSNERLTIMTDPTNNGTITHSWEHQILNPPIPALGTQSILVYLYCTFSGTYDFTLNFTYQFLTPTSSSAPATIDLSSVQQSHPLSLRFHDPFIFDAVVKSFPTDVALGKINSTLGSSISTFPILLNYQAAISVLPFAEALGNQKVKIQSWRLYDRNCRHEFECIHPQAMDNEVILKDKALTFDFIIDPSKLSFISEPTTLTSAEPFLIHPTFEITWRFHDCTNVLEAVHTYDLCTISTRPLSLFAIPDSCLIQRIGHLYNCEWYLWNMTLEAQSIALTVEHGEAFVYMGPKHMFVDMEPGQFLRVQGHLIPITFGRAHIPSLTIQSAVPGKSIVCESLARPPILIRP